MTSALRPVALVTSELALLARPHLIGCVLSIWLQARCARSVQRCSHRLRGQDRPASASRSQHHGARCARHWARLHWLGGDIGPLARGLRRPRYCSLDGRSRRLARQRGSPRLHGRCQDARRARGHRARRPRLDPARRQRRRPLRCSRADSVASHQDAAGRPLRAQPALLDSGDARADALGGDIRERQALRPAQHGGDDGLIRAARRPALATDHRGAIPAQARHELALRCACPSAVSDRSVDTKTLGEKAAWDYVEREKPAFDLVSINPTYCLGPHGLNVINEATKCVSNPACAELESVVLTSQSLRACSSLTPTSTRRVSTSRSAHVAEGSRCASPVRRCARCRRGVRQGSGQRPQRRQALRAGACSTLCPR